MLSAAFLTKSARRKHYPTLNLSGAIGVEALKAGHLFRPEATVGSVLAGLALPLFNGFKISSEIEMREAQQRQALRGYESTVLAALLEVEDCFVAVKQSTGRLEVLKRSAAVAADNEKIALLRYRSGTYDLGHVLDTQRVRLAAEQQAVASATEQTLAQIRLYLALGGPAFGDTAPEPNPQPERPETIALATPAAK
ncbi:MAG: TolC family protein [Puniceicoccales bacterium]|nr:TolC family protein [Puniceicoccales bacterium]